MKIAIIATLIAGASAFGVQKATFAKVRSNLTVDHVRHCPIRR